ncbi:5-bromo-4-chloroindolyl phosphate hydrolysis protein [Bacillus ectoiniformans]|uniref:5-bromo-4-chloroindolyl phosphate hydrolysis family protein n=1 Tax=Bacillus ectoiniformans TaxID=1494429 RepID=UPI00195E66DC|nr:5-bromo-4-chloroindolyl phosphate hydrolysis family protein [Bacillus ectoiniformans]MBM7647727.1 5-bromo-4-chloroindolyl phosphate hydrolysis protein [Bacillus ectoiniformans]
MKHAFSILLRLFVALPLSGIISTIGYSQLNLPLAAGILLFAVSTAAIFMGLGKWADVRLYKKFGLTRKEYYFIQDNMKEAKQKLNRLQSVFIRLRSISSLKQMLELNRLVKRIYSIVKKEPKRFYEAESFFYSHLDSVVELSEKYAWLNSQKIKDQDVKKSLIETKETLGDLTKTLEKDLNKVLAKDIEHLTFELDVAKHSMKKLDMPIDEDERRLK